MPSPPMDTTMRLWPWACKKRCAFCSSIKIWKPILFTVGRMGVWQILQRQAFIPCWCNRKQQTNTTMSIDYLLQPIGFIRSPVKDRAMAPKQGYESAPDAWLEVN